MFHTGWSLSINPRATSTVISVPVLPIPALYTESNQALVLWCGCVLNPGQMVLPTQANSSQATKSKLGGWPNGTAKSSQLARNHSIVWLRPRSHLTITKKNLVRVGWGGETGENLARIGRAWSNSSQLDPTRAKWVAKRYPTPSWKLGSSRGYRLARVSGSTTLPVFQQDTWTFWRLLSNSFSTVVEPDCSWRRTNLQKLFSVIPVMWEFPQKQRTTVTLFSKGSQTLKHQWCTFQESTGHSECSQKLISSKTWIP